MTTAANWADVDVLTDAVDEMGEGPLWNEDDSTVYWVDGGPTSKVLRRYHLNDRRTESWPLDTRAVGLNVLSGGGFLVTFQKFLATMAANPNQRTDIAITGMDFEHERLNDSAVDSAGRLWIGTMDRKVSQPVGCLYRIDQDFNVKKVDEGFTVSNGIAWSPDDSTLYFCDSRPGKLFAYDFDLGRGEISRRRVLLDFAGREGRPDGCAIDSEGFLWIAEIGAGQVIRVAPDGRVAREVKLPIRRPTSVAFGGPDMRTLFITSMSYGLSKEALAAEPYAGRLFAIDAGVAGRRRDRFRMSTRGKV